MEALECLYDTDEMKVTYEFFSGNDPKDFGRFVNRNKINIDLQSKIESKFVILLEAKLSENTFYDLTMDFKYIDNKEHIETDVGSNTIFCKSIFDKEISYQQGGIVFRQFKGRTSTCEEIYQYMLSLSKSLSILYGFDYSLVDTAFSIIRPQINGISDYFINYDFTQYNEKLARTLKPKK